MCIYYTHLHLWNIMSSEVLISVLSQSKSIVYFIQLAMRSPMGNWPQNNIECVSNPCLESCSFLIDMKFKYQCEKCWTNEYFFILNLHFPGSFEKLPLSYGMIHRYLLFIDIRIQIDRIYFHVIFLHSC